MKKIQVSSKFNPSVDIIDAKDENKILFTLPQNHISLAIKIAFWFLFSCFMILVFVKIWHLVTPWFFVEEQQLKQIDSILFSSAISSVMTLFGKKILISEKI